MQAAWIVGWYVIVPLAFASLLTGIIIIYHLAHHRVYSSTIEFSSNLFHYRFLLHMPLVSALAAKTKRRDTANFVLPSELFHPGVGLLVLILIVILSVYKPMGLTPYGWRKHQELRKM